MAFHRRLGAIELDEGSPQVLRYGHIAVISDQNLIYVWGHKAPAPEDVGRPYVQPNDDPLQISIFDYESNKWYCQLTTCLDSFDDDCPPMHMSGSCALLHQSNLYVFGGCAYYARSPALYRLNLTYFVWEFIAPPPDYQIVGRDKCCGWVYKNKLYFFGGYGHIPEGHELNMYGYQQPYLWNFGDDAYNVNTQDDASVPYEAWNNQLLSYDTQSGKWAAERTRGDKPTPRAAHACDIISDTVYIFGGRTTETRTDQLFSLHMPTLTWRRILPSEEEEEALTTNSSSSRWPIGLPSTSLTSDSCSTGSGRSDSSSRCRSISWPAGRTWHTFTAVSSHELILYGGFTADQKVLGDLWMYETISNRWKELRKCQTVDLSALLINNSTDDTTIVTAAEEEEDDSEKNHVPVPALPRRLWHTTCLTRGPDPILISIGGSNKFGKNEEMDTSVVKWPSVFSVRPLTLRRLALSACFYRAISSLPFHHPYTHASASYYTELWRKILPSNLSSWLSRRMQVHVDNINRRRIARHIPPVYDDD